MVRRLIKHFLHWLRQTIAQLKGKKSRLHPPSSNVRQLPAARHQPEPVRQQRQRLSPSETQQPSPTDTPSHTPPIPAKPNPQSPNPAARRASNSSNFRVSLSEYQYSPSAAVQSLSYQLAHPNSPTNPETDQPKSILDLENTFKPTSTEQSSVIQETLNQEKIEQISSPESSNQPQTFLSEIAEIAPSPKSRHDNLEPEPIAAAPPTPPIESSVASILTTTEQDPDTANHGSSSSSIFAHQSPVIIKQGVVKLLFKLKKNNYHGYIAPHDGSKDIIFHQKYIGEDVFCDLERGMDVEVTAHITEGKAYADRVRIL